jgi:hypothetical protein
VEVFQSRCDWFKGDERGAVRGRCLLGEGGREPREGKGREGRR